MEHNSKESEEKKIFSRVKQFIKSNRRTFFKVMMYALLLTLFVQYYLRDYAAEYFKNRSTFTSVTKHQYTLPLPNIIVCTDPSFKPSKAEKYGYSFASQIWNDKEEKYKQFYHSPWDTYQKLSYLINKDVKFRVGPHWKAEKTLREGVNFVRNHTIKVSKLATYRHGLCTMIEPQQKIMVGQDFRLRIQWKNNILNSTDMPEKLNLYLTSKKGWHGIFLDDWPYIKPAKINLKSGKLN